MQPIEQWLSDLTNGECEMCPWPWVHVFLSVWCWSSSHISGPPPQLHPEGAGLVWQCWYGNAGIGKEGTHQLIQALTVNTTLNGGGLMLSKRCEKYATQCTEYITVMDRILYKIQATVRNYWMITTSHVSLCTNHQHKNVLGHIHL